jgi:hypothetical protein
MHRFAGPTCLFTCLICLPMTVTARPSATTQTGYVRVVAESGTTAPAGLAILGLTNNGTLINEAGVPAGLTTRSGRVFVDIAGSINTGLALANPSNEEVSVSFYFTDGAGNNTRSGSFTIAANHQLAAFFTERPFALPGPFWGTFTFNSSRAIAAISLRNVVNERNEVLITTIPVTPVGTGFGGNIVSLPPAKAGWVWTTQVVLVNPGNTPLSGTLRFFGQPSSDGNVQTINVDVSGVIASTFNYSIPPRTAVKMVARPVRTVSPIGSVRIVPVGGSPSSLAILSYVSGTTTITTPSVTASAPGNGFRMYIESSGVFGHIGSLQTGVSISNPSASRFTIQLDALRFDGTPTGLSVSMEIPPAGQIAKFANELFSGLPSNFQGIIKISSPSPVFVVGIRARYNERGELLMTTTPPYDDSSSAAGETDFAHFVAGGGYSTQLILLSTGPSQKGSLFVVSQDGVVLPSTILQPQP